MGTSLTGTKPKDTYDSLIKVGDNGPISGTAKYLSDGLGNDLPIAVSTSNVGIGTSSPAAKLQTQQTSAGSGVVGMLLQNVGLDANTAVSLDFAPHENTTSPVTLARINAIRTSDQGPTDIAFSTYSTTLGEKVRILSSGGITFNGDTAAANALDDYEEGTWTPTVTSAGGSGSPTYGTRHGSYTKIGRQVVIQFYIDFQKNTLSGGTLQMGGLPFTAQPFLYPESAILIDNLATALTNPLLQVGAGFTTADVIQNNGATSNHAGLSINTYLSAGTMTLRGTATYFV